MRFTSKIIPLIIGGAVGSTVAGNLIFSAVDSSTAIASVQLAQALTPEEVNLRAKQIVVRIDGASIGSGSIVDYENDVYTVLTNWHVMKQSGAYVIRTIDGRQHQVIPDSIKRLAGLDLAVFQFSSQQNYQVAELGNSSNLSEGQTIYFAGYPGELRREDNRNYRFFNANVVGILSQSTENGYSLVYSGEAFPGMSGSPIFNREGLMIGIHGEANIHALSGATSNYGIPVLSYREAMQRGLARQSVAEVPSVEGTVEGGGSPHERLHQEAIAKLNAPPAATQPQPKPPATPQQSTEAATTEAKPSTTPGQATEVNPQPEVADNNNQNSAPQKEATITPENIDSVPTFSSTPQTPVEQSIPEIVITSEIVLDQEQSQPESSEAESPDPTPTAEESEASATANTEQSPPEAAVTPQATEPKKVDAPAPRRISLVSPKTGIDYTKLRNLLRDGKWSEADIHTYQLIEQVVKLAKQQNKNFFIELKTIADFACYDIRTANYLWQKYSDDKFGFSPQQKVWQSVNQEGDFSTQTWRSFATKVGWKEGAVDSGSGYLLYEELNFEPNQAPSGHLPWWFALPDEEQNVLKSLFTRCNFNPTAAELEAEARQSSPNPAQNEPKKQPDSNKAPQSVNN
ncbi:MAG: GUN4 domain-containing protein [Cyanobacteria bacterium J06621_8]